MLGGLKTWNTGVKPAGLLQAGALIAAHMVQHVAARAPETEVATLTTGGTNLQDKKSEKN